jgi:hypothetical protein
MPTAAATGLAVPHFGVVDVEDARFAFLRTAARGVSATPRGEGLSSSATLTMVIVAANLRRRPFPGKEAPAVD